GPSYSPRTGMFYLAARENGSSMFVKGEANFEEGQNYSARGANAGARRARPEVGSDEEKYTAVRALDPQTGERKWEFTLNSGNSLSQCAGLSCSGAAGILTTATDVLFAGGREGNFVALDARTGALLWKVLLGGQINMGPVSYSVDGKQYVAVNSGSSLFVFGLR
ncbi:MAG TPA: PQQ-binding-like beta-propeller repeat protein, partial [Bryobacteraceae bacterium]|nr:PQQ-binding-like beta-propeller repeat protein [Bryobacteraceae bacterium]